MGRIKSWLFVVAMLTLMQVTAGAQAMFARMGEDELLAASAFVVVGTLVRQEPSIAGGETRQVGVIEVEFVLKGGSNLATVRLALPDASQPVASDAITYRVGAKGLWYLRELGSGDPPIYAADHPQRFVPAAEAADPIDRLRRAGNR